MMRALPAGLMACVLFLELVPSSDAQTRDFDPLNPRGCSMLHGVVSQTPGAASGAFVELRSITAATIPLSAPIIRGTFDLDCVASAVYELRVLDSRGQIIHIGQIRVRDSFESVNITLSKAQTERPLSQWVSVRQLQRKVDRKAEGKLQKAHEAAKRGNLDQAIRYSREALVRDPAYQEAYFELGYAYARHKQFEEAAQQFSRAVELDPDFVWAQRNLALSMLHLKRYDAAEAAARRALQIAHALPDMDYTLGVSLGEQKRNLDEAVRHLDRASTAHPHARLAAVKFLVQAGRRSEAATRLEHYLKVTGDSHDRKNLESILSQLK